MIHNNLTITEYQRRHRQAINDLLFRNNRVHTHLDWHDANTWLDTFDVPIRLAWHQDKLVGVMASSVPMGGTVWLRIVAIADGISANPVLHTLWENMRESLKRIGVHTVAILIINDWLDNYIPQLRFSYEEDIVTLKRSGKIIPEPPPHAIIIRDAERHELRRITEVDQLAFTPPWQLLMQDIRQAQRIASTCTVAIHDQQIIGYQLSTRYRQTGHLARLAVLPDTQGKGIGSILLDKMIRYFLDRRVHSVTVNTQSTNVRSQRLYERYGFRRNGYDLPVWMAST